MYACFLDNRLSDRLLVEELQRQVLSCLGESSRESSNIRDHAIDPFLTGRWIFRTGKFRIG